MQFFRKETIRQIARNKRKIESKLKVKIIVSGNSVAFEGNEEDKYVTERVLEALERNFPLNVAFLLSTSDYTFEEIPIKNFTRKKNLSIVRGRIIGTKGKALEVVQELSDSFIILQQNTINIIAPHEKIREVVVALRALVQGTKHSNVYKYLERSRKRFRPESLGLK